MDTFNLQGLFTDYFLFGHWRLALRIVDSIVAEVS